VRRRLSPSLVVAVVALVVALCGTAWAGGYIITKTSQIKPSVRKALKGKRGARGATGPQGPQGAQGPVGPAGPSVVNALARVEQTGVIGPGVVSGVTVNCPAGQTAVSGGYSTAGVGYVFSNDSFGGSGWSVGYDNYEGSVSANVKAIAYCAPSGLAVGARASAARVDRFHDAIARQRATHR
jgi:hypothetical protein